MSILTKKTIKNLEKLALKLIPKPGTGKAAGEHEKAEDWKKVVRENFSSGHYKGLAHLAAQIFDAPLEQFLPGESNEGEMKKGQAAIYTSDRTDGASAKTGRIFSSTARSSCVVINASAATHLALA